MTGITVSSIGWAIDRDCILPGHLNRSLRRADDLTKRGVAAADLAFSAAQERDLGAHETGIFVGTAFGPLETNFRFLDSLFDDGEGQASPTLFSHSVHNAMAGYLARIYTVHGPVSTQTSYAWPFLNALQQAWGYLESGAIKRALVVGAEMTSPPLEYAREGFLQKDGQPLCSGAVAWIIDGWPTASHKGVMLRELVISEKTADPVLFLTREGEAFTGAAGQVGKPSSHLFDYAVFFSTEIQKILRGEAVTCRVKATAPFGTAVLDACRR